MRKLVVANWKMNPQTAEEARKLISAWEHDLRRMDDSVEVVVAAPFVFLPGLSTLVKQVQLGAQNASWQDKGALTGEISPKQLVELGVSHVLLGHSERRLF